MKILKENKYKFFVDMNWENWDCTRKSLKLSTIMSDHEIEDLNLENIMKDLDEYIYFRESIHRGLDMDKATPQEFRQQFGYNSLNLDKIEMPKVKVMKNKPFPKLELS